MVQAKTIQEHVDPVVSSPSTVVTEDPVVLVTEMVLTGKYRLKMIVV